MKLPSVFSCAVLILLLLASSSATTSALQNQAASEQALSAALRDGNGIIIGGTDDFAFTFRAPNRIHRHLAIQDSFGDPTMINGFQDLNDNPARNGFINNPARGRFMLNAPIRR